MSAKRRDEAPAEEIGPGQSYLPFVVMEDLLDKLKLINYDTEFTVEFKVKPANRHYFAIQTNPGEQFFMFSSLATWLIRKCGIQLDTPQESDDPNTTILNILDVLRSMGTAVDFPPSKLKQGWGEQVIFVLDHLADMALKKKQFMWKMLIPPEEGQEEETTVDDNVEVTLEKIEEEMMEEEAEGDDDDDEGPVMDLDALKNQTANRFASSNFNKPEEVMQSSVDSAEWRLEVERVLPQLKVVIHPDSKDWRSHLDQIQQYRKEMEEGMTVAKTQLDRLSADITSTLDKAGSREKYLNAQLDSLLLEYRAAQEILAQAREQYRLASGGVTERSRILVQISEELEQAKQEMEERGSSMTDGTPLVQIRKALARLKAEVSQMDVRIGVALHTLLQAKLRERGSLRVASDVPTTGYNFVF